MSKVVYDPPWICFTHNFFTQDKAKFFQHLNDIEHYVVGSNAPCERCEKLIASYSVPYTGINEPVIILCDECRRFPNVYKWIRAKRRADYPAIKATE